ncbi:hypothetical protein MA16_Dca024735 [Dendrobium catenatum]|uniref:Uncharacterized protein n=1 Tax=Dendrobium catenatum TaxID=906689 RepID=A0A2I0WNL9_9ASPA|nr:hypothetical protein MA16_Dca024735 [Dendrobium catenatum]
MEIQRIIAVQVLCYLAWPAFFLLWRVSISVLAFWNLNPEVGFTWFSFAILIFYQFQTWDRFFWKCGFFVSLPHSSLLMDLFTSTSRVYIKDYGSIFVVVMGQMDDDEQGLSLRAMEGLFGNLTRFCGFFLTSWRHCDGQFCWVTRRLLRFCGQPVPPSASIQSRF